MFGDLPRGHHKNNSMHKVRGYALSGAKLAEVLGGLVEILNKKGRQE